jgi:1,4-dihydroxy-2-naphthoyl-CoA hydrolase
MTSETHANVVKMVPFAAHLGFEITALSRSEVVVEVVLKPEYCTTMGTAHGGFLMTLADFAGAVGAFQVLPEGSKGTTTIESKTNMIGAAPVGTRLRAVSTLLHGGRRTSVWSTRVEAGDGKLISMTSQTQLVL